MTYFTQKRLANLRQIRKFLTEYNRYIDIVHHRDLHNNITILNLRNNLNWEIFFINDEIVRAEDRIRHPEQKVKFIPLG